MKRKEKVGQRGRGGRKIIRKRKRRTKKVEGEGEEEEEGK